MTTIDPLEKLFVEHSVSAREIASFLLDYCRIDLESNCIKFFDDRWILIESRVLLCLLCLRVMVYKQQRRTNAARPIEIAELIDGNGGSIRPKLRQLLKERLIQCVDGEDDGRMALYSIPTGGVYAAMKYVRENTRSKE